MNNGSRFDVLNQDEHGKEVEKDVGLDMDIEEQPGVVSDSDLGNPAGRTISLGRVENSDVEINSMEETVAENQEQILEKLEPIFLGNKIEVGNKEVTIRYQQILEKISDSNILVETQPHKETTKDLVDLRSGHVTLPKKIPVKGPILKKSLVRKSPSQKPIGKENIGVPSKVT